MVFGPRYLRWLLYKDADCGTSVVASKDDFARLIEDTLKYWSKPQILLQIYSDGTYMKNVYLCFSLPLPRELCRLIADYVCSPVVTKKLVIDKLMYLYERI